MRKAARALSRNASLRCSKATALCSWASRSFLAIISAFSENAKLAGIDNETIAYIIEFAKKIDNDFALKRLFIHMHYMFFLSPDYIKNIGNNSLKMETVLKEEGFTYNLLLALSGANVSKKYFEKSCSTI